MDDAVTLGKVQAMVVSSPECTATKLVFLLALMLLLAIYPIAVSHTC